MARQTRQFVPVVEDGGAWRRDGPEQAASTRLCIFSIGLPSTSRDFTLHTRRAERTVVPALIDLDFQGVQLPGGLGRV